MLKRKKLKLPAIGMRIVKSMVAIALCYVIDAFRKGSGIVFYSQLAALWCMQTYVKNSLKNAKQRTIGTMIGALYGLIVILVSFHFSISPVEHSFLYNLLVSFMILIVLYTTVVIKKKEASYFSCVVFLSIVVNHLSDQNPYLFVWNRFLDTMIGIIIGIGINAFHLPKKKNKDILFISGLDDTLLNKDENMTPYSRIELNRMIADGAKFTIATRRTPASMMDPMRDIYLNLPVIAMDGAVLYDIQQKRYLKKYVISYEKANEMITLMKTNGIHCFVNVVIDDLLVIYYQDMEDEVQNKLVEEMRRSPFRNYVKRESPENQTIVYLMVLDQIERIERFYLILKTMGYTEEFKILKYNSDDYPGYAYIKIYNKNARKMNMLAYLKEELQVQQVITFGSIPNQYDVLIEPGDVNRVVRVIKKLYEPVVFGVGNHKKKRN